MAFQHCDKCPGMHALDAGNKATEIAPLIGHLLHKINPIRVNVGVQLSLLK